MNRSNKFKYKVAKYKTDTPKPRSNEVVIVPQDNRLMEIPPYLNSSKLPSWWSKLPVNKNSIRRCQGTYDYLNLGFTIPMWTDVTVRPAANGIGHEFKLENFGDMTNFTVEFFSTDSAGGCPFGSQRKDLNSNYPKLVSPWRYFTPKGISLMALPIAHEPNPNYIVMPGLVHTDFYNQVHIVIAVLTDKEFTIPAGTPMQHMVPIRRSDNIKNIIWGNESMYRFHLGQGLGTGCITAADNSQLYRKRQKESDLEAEKEENRKWNFFKK